MSIYAILAITIAAFAALYFASRLPALIVGMTSAGVMLGIFLYDAAMQRLLVKASDLPVWLQHLAIDHAGRHALNKTRFITYYPAGAHAGYRLAREFGVA